jgi:hypothetical protein
MLSMLEVMGEWEICNVLTANGSKEQEVQKAKRQGL